MVKNKMGVCEEDECLFVKNMNVMDGFDNSGTEIANITSNNVKDLGYCNDIQCRTRRKSLPRTDAECLSGKN